MQITVEELKKLLKKEEILPSVTFSVEVKKSSESLKSPIEVAYGEDRVNIYSLGVYNIGELRVWVVKS